MHGLLELWFLRSVCSFLVNIAFVFSSRCVKKKCFTYAKRILRERTLTRASTCTGKPGPPKISEGRWHAFFAILLSFFNAKSDGCPLRGRPLVVSAGARPQIISKEFENVLFCVSHLHIFDACKLERLKSVEELHQI